MHSREVPECPVFSNCSRSKASAGAKIFRPTKFGQVCDELAFSRSLIVTAGNHFVLAGLQSGPGTAFESNLCSVFDYQDTLSTSGDQA